MQKCRFVGKSQSVLIMINPMIFTRTRRSCACAMWVQSWSQGGMHRGRWHGRDTACGLP
jgi:hypothetical protein|eukprot:SAG25_NODE_919_length_4769_cov_1.695289_7_plen_59_part_00